MVEDVVVAAATGYFEREVYAENGDEGLVGTLGSLQGDNAEIWCMMW